MAFDTTFVRTVIRSSEMIFPQFNLNVYVSHMSHVLTTDVILYMSLFQGGRVVQGEDRIGRSIE